MLAPGVMATILVIENYPPNRELLATVLRHAGHRVLEAGNGREGLTMACAHQPDLVIADVLMPAMDGLEFVHQLRQSDGSAAATPVIFSTATYHRQEALRLAEWCGVSRVMHKICDPITIRDTVDAALSERGMAPKSSAMLRGECVGIIPLPEKTVALDPMSERSVTEIVLRKHAEVISQSLLEKTVELDAVWERLTAVVDLSRQLACETSARRLFERCCQGARELIGARYAVLSIPALEDGSTAQRYVCGLADAEADDLTVDWASAAVLATVIRERRTVRLRTEDCDAGSIGLPPGHPSLGAFLGVPIASATYVYGWLYFGDRLCADGFSDEDARIATMLGSQVAVAYQNLERIWYLEQQASELEREVAERRRAEQELRGSSERLKALSHQLLKTQETERQTIARELHDEVGQALTALTLNLASIERAIDDESTQRVIQESVRITDRALEATRNLSVALRPTVLDDLGLVPALRSYVDQQARRVGFEASFRADVADNPVPPELALACFRIAQEALTNIALHARTQTVSTALSLRDGQLNLVIQDDGAGFDVRGALARATRGESSGILTMCERATLLGGQVTIDSAAGRGTTLTARLPLA